MEKIEVGEGYRELAVGEKLQPGDQYYFMGLWIGSTGGNEAHPDAAVGGPGYGTKDGPYRRWVADSPRPDGIEPEDVVMAALLGKLGIKYA